MKQNYWSKTKCCLQGWHSFVSSVWFELDVGKIFLDKGAEAACHCRVPLTSLWPHLSPVQSLVQGVVTGTLRLRIWNKKNEAFTSCWGLFAWMTLLFVVWWKYILLMVFLGCNRWFSATNIPLAKQCLNWTKLKPPLVLITPRIFLLSVEIQVQKSFWSICYNTSSHRG